MLVCLNARSPAGGAVLAESGTFKWRDLATGSWTQEKALRYRAWPGFLSSLSFLFCGGTHSLTVQAAVPSHPVCSPPGLLAMINLKLLFYQVLCRGDENTQYILKKEPEKSREEEEMLGYKQSVCALHYTCFKSDLKLQALLSSCPFWNTMFLSSKFLVL